ncbi:MAG: flagellar basal body P-ring formation chaperone FlgA [Pseudomonadota bacterium]
MPQFAKISTKTNIRWALHAVILTLLLWIVTLQTAVAQDWQDTTVIEKTATEFVEAAIDTNAGSRISIKAGNLDKRLRLQRCETPLEAFTTPGADLRKGGTVGVRCTAGKGWKIYVPVRVSMVTSVLVAQHALARGAALTAGDVRLVERDVATLPSGYLTNIARLQGQALRRHVLPGSIITPSMLVQSKTIHRGQRVTLLAAGSALSIRMAGTAMSNGGLGERISVKNLSSGRTVEGVVRSAETVEVLQY